MPGNQDSERDSERRPLLDNQQQDQHDHDDASHNDNTNDVDHGQKVAFSEHDDENPREWPLSWKYIQVLQIYIISFICPMASSSLAPATNQISSEFNTTSQIALLSQAGFVCMLGLGPLFHAPMSETFGRRPIFLINLAIFTILQIPTALAPNIWSLVVLRTISGFFGSVGVANGGGSVTDMFETHTRAKVLGFYLTGPLLGPTIGPLVGGIIIGQAGPQNWRLIIWTVFVSVAITTVATFQFLGETQAKAILQQRLQTLRHKNPQTKYYLEGEVSGQQRQQQQPNVFGKIGKNSTRAVKILFTQPIVMTMTIYQSLIFSSMYTLYSQYTTIFGSDPYNFTPTQTGLAYLGPATGFIVTATFTILYVDKVYDHFSSSSHKNQDEQDDEKIIPEYRLPLANIGAVLLPISLFWFGWTVQCQQKWIVPVVATALFGAAQVSIFNCVQTYYIDSYEENAASALAAGAFLRSMVGGIVPVFISGLFERFGYGWGMSLFGGLSLVLMPAPLLFYRFGRTLREKFPFEG